MVDNCDPPTNAAKCSTSGLKFFLRILPEVVYKLNCVVARNACWFTMAALSDGIDSQMKVKISTRSLKMLMKTDENATWRDFVRSFMSFL